MRELLCQVCAAPADENERGALWLTPDQRQLDPTWADWPEGAHSQQPPLCLRCARISVRTCPWLRGSHLVVRAHSRVVGVAGAVFGNAWPRPCVLEHAAFVANDDPVRFWVQADQLVREWTGTSIDTL